MFAKELWIFTLSVLVLFFGFNSNTWRAVDPRLFVPVLTWGDNLLVVGRLAKSRDDGILSSGGLLAMKTSAAAPPGFPGASDDRFTAYTQKLPLAAYRPYKSHVGGQGILFSCLDRVLALSPETTLRFFRALTALLSSLVLASIVVWFLKTFGSWAAWAVLSSMVLCKWLVLSGGHLYWSLWAFYLPMAAVMVHLESRPAPAYRNALVFFALVFSTVFVKCLMSGYDYITTTLLMLMVPVVFYARLDRWPLGRILQYGLLAAAASALAVFLTLAILCVQISAVQSTLLHGVQHIWNALASRTWRTPINPLNRVPIVNVSAWQVVAMYLKGSFLDFFCVRYGHLIAVFAAASVYLHFAGRRETLGEDRVRVRALILATWFSLLAPLSWFLIFKAHSVVHLHANCMVWQMPFTFYGFALCGRAFQCAWRDLRCFR